MRVLICGSRHFNDAAFLFRVMDALLKERGITSVIHGATSGAEAIGDTWARLRELPVQKYLADWDRQGKWAGPLRNVRMLKEGKPDFVVAFDEGNGTEYMKKIARKANVEVLEPSRC